MRTLELHKMSESKNDLGKVISQYEKLTDFNGVVDQLSANEVLAADKLGKESTHILMTFDTSLNVTEQDRIVDGDQKYRVKTVDNPMGLGQHLEIILEFEGVIEDVV